MKFLCPACERLVPLATWRAEGAMLVLTCPTCAVESRTESEVAALGSAAEPAPAALQGVGAAPWPTLDEAGRLAAASARSAGPFAVPAGHCPKCIAPRSPQAVACASCGLVFANAGAQDYVPPAPLEAEWTGLWEHWTDAAAHERVLASATVQGELATVGRLYRLRLAQAPQDAFAKRGRDEVLRRASLPSVLSPPPAAQREGPPRWQLVVAAVAVMALLGLVIALIRQLNVSKM